MAYRDIDREIAKCTEGLATRPEQSDYARRGDLYKKKVLAASRHGDADVVESTLLLALADYTMALSQGDKGQLTKAEWYQHRGVLHKAVADTLPRGKKRKFHLESAVGDFSNALHVKHKAADVFLLRGEVRFLLGFTEAAIDDFTSAMPNASLNGKIQALCGRSEAWCSAQEYQNGHADLTQAIQVCTTCEVVDQAQLSRLLYMRACISRKTQQDDACLTDVGKSLELRPQYPEALQLRAQLCYDMGLYSESDTDLCDALRLGSSDSPALANLYRKLLSTQGVFLHVKSARDLHAQSPHRPSLYVSYSIKQTTGTASSLITGRTLSYPNPDWEETIRFHLPSRNYAIELIVRDEDPTSNVGFLGKAVIDLSVHPTSRGEQWLPLKPAMTRTADVMIFNRLTGGLGTICVAWSMAQRIKPTVGSTPEGGVSSLADSLPTGASHDLTASTGITSSEHSSIESLFSAHDPKDSGFISEEAVRSIYNGFDTFGAPRDDVGGLLRKFRTSPEGLVSLNEFTLVMLRLIKQ
ncbi:putative UDP-N-acetylglucosamine--peptide N-acetylglucosaminyltransferase [Diplonema papillatum]|nr:putative UDP-N-acetylglucosamine--peptide N-acetylglucosaminyltransferase [Diplonema papillatum]